MWSNPKRLRSLRKTYLFMSLSLDGYFEGPNHDVSWHKVDDEFNRFATQQLRQTDLLMFGRRIYQDIEAPWPKIAVDPSTSEDNLEIARLVNNTSKMVFSRTLDSVRETENWKNVTLVREFDPAEIRRLKERPGKEIAVGGSNLALSFVREGLLDEFRFMVTPVVLGRGTPILDGMLNRMDLELTKMHRFDSGNVLLYYKPVMN